jgi:uncharacterized membrane protein
MSNRLAAAFSRHSRFYVALACGIIAFAAARIAGLPVALLAGGDIFYLVFLALCSVMIAGQTADDLKRRAKSEDEGIGIVVVIILATMLFFSAAVFEALAKKHGIEIVPLALAGIGAPLGWFVLHTVMAHYYADLHYFDDPSTTEDDDRDLEFPGRGDPGPWDFLYFSFVIGMTCQVSDVQITERPIRRLALLHGVLAFVYNTVILALSINIASGLL